MQIRKASVDDAEQIKTLVSSLCHFYLEDDNAELPEWFSKTLEISAFEKRLSDSAFDNVVCCLNNAVVGYLALQEKRHLYHLFVAERYQGKGIARALWDHATADSDSNIYTVRSSLFAVPVYKRFGFKESDAAGSKDGIGFQPMMLKR